MNSPGAAKEGTVFLPDTSVEEFACQQELFKFAKSWGLTPYELASITPSSDTITAVMKGVRVVAHRKVTSLDPRVEDYFLTFEFPGGTGTNLDDTAGQACKMYRQLNEIVRAREEIKTRWNAKKEETVRGHPARQAALTRDRALGSVNDIYYLLGGSRMVTIVEKRPNPITAFLQSLFKK